MIRSGMSVLDPEGYLEAKAAAEALDEAQVGSPAERRFTNQFTDMPDLVVRPAPGTARTTGAAHRPVGSWMTRLPVPDTAAPATLLARNTVLFRSGPTPPSVTVEHALPVLVDLCGCIYRPGGGLVRYCPGTAPIHMHEEGPR